MEPIQVHWYLTHDKGRRLQIKLCENEKNGVGLGCDLNPVTIIPYFTIP